MDNRRVAHPLLFYCVSLTQRFPAATIPAGNPVKRSSRFERVKVERAFFVARSLTAFSQSRLHSALARHLVEGANDRTGSDRALSD